MDSKMLRLVFLSVTVLGAADNAFTSRQFRGPAGDKATGIVWEDKGGNENEEYEVSPGYPSTYNTRDHYTRDDYTPSSYEKARSVISKHNNNVDNANEVNHYGGYQGADSNYQRDGLYGGSKDDDNKNGYNHAYGYRHKHGYHRHQHSHNGNGGGDGDYHDYHHSIDLEEDHDRNTDNDDEKNYYHHGCGFLGCGHDYHYDNDFEIHYGDTGIAWDGGHNYHDDSGHNQHDYDYNHNEHNFGNDNDDPDDNGKTGGPHGNFDKGFHDYINDYDYHERNHDDGNYHSGEFHQKY